MHYGYTPETVCSHINMERSFEVTEKDDDGDDQMIEGIEDGILFYGIIPAIVGGTAILLGVYYVRKRKEEIPSCPYCDRETDFIEEYESYYCWDCEEYL